MIQKLNKVEGRYTLVLEDQICEQLGIDEDTALQLTVEGRRLIVTATDQSSDDPQFRAAIEETNQRFGDALRRLAE